VFLISKHHIGVDIGVQVGDAELLHVGLEGCLALAGRVVGALAGRVVGSVAVNVHIGVPLGGGDKNGARDVAAVVERLALADITIGEPFCQYLRTFSLKVERKRY
jgi:hypothetical protein